MNLRVCHGFDAPGLVEGRALVMGGVTMLHDRCLAGHSDAAVMLHAISDAILGALALGDLGSHFPATEQWKDADSRTLLRHVFSLASDDGYAVGNVDATVIAQAPKLAPHIDAMRANIAQDLACDVDRVSVKATTTDRLGTIGRGEGIAAMASVLLVRATPQSAT